jgi:hypothetical protein
MVAARVWAGRVREAENKKMLIKGNVLYLRNTFSESIAWYIYYR